jgi:hypothetical protein
MDNVTITCSPNTNDITILENGLEIMPPFTDSSLTRIYNLGIAERQNDGNVYQCTAAGMETENTTLFVMCEWHTVCGNYIMCHDNVPAEHTQMLGLYVSGVGYN